MLTSNNESTGISKQMWKHVMQKKEVKDGLLFQKGRV